MSKNEANVNDNISENQKAIMATSLEDFISEFKAFDANTARRMGGNNGKPSICIVNSERNGKRLMLSEALFQLLESPKKLSFLFKENHLAIANEFPKTEAIKFSPDKRSHIIYSSGLVQDIVKKFNLDYSNRTSLSFNDIEVKRMKNATGAEIPVALVTMTVNKNDDED